MKKAMFILKTIILNNKQFIACVLCCLIAFTIIMLCNFNVIPEAAQTPLFFVCLAFIAAACVFNYYATKHEEAQRRKNKNV